ncbi:MAG: hypothetical protein ACPG9A_13505 [Paracoccaceae bacterium]
MKVMAKVTISGCVYEEWKAFYDSYQADRARFIKDETVLQQGDHAAEVVFEIIDLEGLKDLSQRGDILDFETKNGIVVGIEPL